MGSGLGSHKVRGRVKVKVRVRVGVIACRPALSALDVDLTGGGGSSPVLVSGASRGCGGCW